MQESRSAYRVWFCLAALWCGLSVAMGAFGAHALKDRLTETRDAEVAQAALANWETASHYQMVHGLAALAAVFLAIGGWRPDSRGSRSSLLACQGFLLGSLIFSGCLYAMVLGAPRVLGAVVPIGGLLMIASWGVLTYAGWQRMERPAD